MDFMNFIDKKCISFSPAQPGPGQPYAPAGWAGGAYQPWPNQPAPTGVPVTPNDPGKWYLVICLKKRKKKKKFQDG